MDFLSHRYAAIALLSVGLVANPVQAQVIPDSTLPTAVSSPDNRNFAIDGGARSGNNLFHSFSQFSIPTTGSATFNNPLDVQNIFARVTGGVISNIDGILSANGSANIFLLNPSGLQFGPNAQLNLGGSFLGTTASSIQFAEGVEFSAVNPSPLLTVSIPIGLQMGQNPKPITVQGSGHQISPTGALVAANSALQVQPGNTLGLVGGIVNLEGGVLTAPQGQIALGSVAGGTVGFMPTAQGWTFDYSGASAFQDIHLTQAALLSVVGDGGGALHLQGRRVSLQDGSVGEIVNTGPQAATGQLNVQATEAVALSGTTTNEQVTSGLVTISVDRGNSSNILIVTPQLTVKDGAEIIAIAPAIGTTGRGGEINVQATELIEVTGSSPQARITSGLLTSTESTNNAGNVTLSTRRLSILDGSSVGAYSFGAGAAGNVAINATELVQTIGIEPVFLQPSIIGSTALNAGNAGQVTINTQRLVVQAGGRIDSSSVATGNAGSVTVNASDSVEVSGRVSGSRNPSLIISSVNILDGPLRIFAKIT
jgi:filamentous hemagglutinin family protein